MKRIITIAVFFVLFSQMSFGQWRKLADFNNSVFSVFFKDHSSIPLDGFVGVINYTSTTENKLWRTEDGGATWKEIVYPLNSSGRYPPPSSFTFKNPMEGWFSCFASYGIYRTIDGGNVWNRINDWNGNASSVYYCSSTNRLFCSDMAPYAYSTDGVNLLPSGLPPSEATACITFSDDLHGIMSYFNPNQGMIITSDGGITWSEVTIHSEFFQPVGIPNTRTFFAISEACVTNPGKAGVVVRSDNGGATWNELYKYPRLGSSLVTGMMQTGKDMSLFFQTTTDGSEGIMMSVDSGRTFMSICGPVNLVDTRFYVRDTFIYAGDRFGGLWLNTTGIGSNSIPQLSKNSISLVSEFCNVKEDTLVFTLFDSCNGRQAELLEASVSGSNRFSVASGFVPRTIVPNDTVRIIYTADPNSSATDNATLNLKLKLGWKIFDTVITLTGRNITPHLDITLTPVLTANNLIAGKEAECNIFSSNKIQDRGLDKVTFDLTYDNDLLEVAEITAQAGMSATYAAPIVTNGIARLPITITGNNMTVDSLLPMVSVKFRTFLTDTTLSTIELSTIQLNDDDPGYKDCTLSATGDSTTFTQASICGDSTIRSFMQTGKLIDILSIRPNPTSGDATVSFESFTSDKAQLQLLDELGKVVLEESVVTKRGMNDHTIAIPKHWSGTFYLRLQMGKTIATGKLIVQ